jgi:hypothetical protein
MSDTKCLVVTCGYFGDIAFASSLANKMQHDFTHIDYLIGYPQMYRLMMNNPFIRNVYVSDLYSPYPQHNGIDYDSYDKIIKLQPLNYMVTPCEEYQQFAGITNPSSEYIVYTQPEYDTVANSVISELKEQYNKPVVALMSNWESKTYLFTEEQYKLGIDVPNLGYGGKHRDTSFIINSLQETVTFYEVGIGNMNQQQTTTILEDHVKSLLFEASILKHCDAFLGTDGGLATIAAGVGCKTIITGDFNYQLYGPNGVLKKIADPQLGPDKYFPKFGHVTINPYYTDNQVVNQIIENVKCDTQIF